MIDGLDLFVFNAKDETPFDIAQTLDINTLTRNHIEYTATRVWNEIGARIEEMLYQVCEDLPLVLINLIGEYIPTRVILKAERDAENLKLNPPMEVVEEQK